MKFPFRFFPLVALHSFVQPRGGTPALHRLRRRLSSGERKSSIGVAIGHSTGLSSKLVKASLIFFRPFLFHVCRFFRGRRHCVYHTDSFDRSVERCVNFLGDADSTGSMVGQMAGAIYGAQAIDPRFIANLQRWDRKGLVALRAALLFAAEATE